MVCACGFSTHLRGQHDTQISNYAFNQIFFNPAFAGNQERIEASILQRSQYIGFKGAPVVWNLSVSSPFAVLDTRHGAMFALNSDNIGALNKLHFALGYTYWHRLPKADARIGIGVSMGAVSYTFAPEGEWVNNDPAIPANAEASSAAFDVNAGIFWQGRDFSVGLSCTHINQPQTLTNSGKNTFSVGRTFYLNGDYHWQTPIEELELAPSAMVTSVNMSLWQATLGCHAVYKQRYWGGLSYRIADALGISLGMLFKHVRFGLLYEYPLSRMIGFNIGTTELFAAYLFDLNLKRKVRKYKSIRFL